MRTTFFLTIGQSHRPDPVPEILGILGYTAAKITALQAQALAGLSWRQVRSGFPRAEGIPVVSRSRTGYKTHPHQSTLARVHE